MLEEDSLPLLNYVDDRMVFGVRYMSELLLAIIHNVTASLRFQAGIGIFLYTSLVAYSPAFLNSYVGIWRVSKPFL